MPTVTLRHVNSQIHRLDISKTRRRVSSKTRRHVDSQFWLTSVAKPIVASMAKASTSQSGNKPLGVSMKAAPEHSIETLTTAKTTQNRQQIAPRFSISGHRRFSQGPTDRTKRPRICFDLKGVCSRELRGSARQTFDESNR